MPTEPGLPAGDTSPADTPPADTPPADTRPIERRIADAFDGLTESERRLAQAIRDIEGGLAPFAAQELAARAGVSNATAARFFHRLGYASYAEARRQARDRPAWASPAAELAAVRPDQDGSFAAHAAHECRNLLRTARDIPPAAIAEATRILAAADTVHVVGFRNSAVLAAYARTVLANVKPRVTLLPAPGMTLAEDLASIAPGHALLAIGFRRRVALLREVMAAATEAGAPLILVADASAAAVPATVTLRCHAAGSGMFDSYAAPMALLNHLANATALALGPAATARLARIEDLHARLGSFAEGAGTTPRTRR